VQPQSKLAHISPSITSSESVQFTTRITRARITDTMLSFRQAARAAPRTLSRFASAGTTAFRQRAAVRPSALARMAQATILRPRQAAPAFSTSALRAAPNGETDEELSAKLESELQFEEEASQDEQLPASVSDFIANSPFEIEDVAGREDVKLTRTFGDEK